MEVWWDLIVTDNSHNLQWRPELLLPKHYNLIWCIRKCREGFQFWYLFPEPVFFCISQTPQLILAVGHERKSAVLCAVGGTQENWI